MDHMWDLAGRPAQWIQPKSFERHFELHGGEGARLGTLRFESAFGSLATFEISSGRWTFKRVGFFSPRVTVRAAGSDADIGIFTPKWSGGGTLVLSEGRTCAWDSANFWGTRWHFADASGNPLIRFSPGTEEEGFKDLFRSQATVEVTPEASGMKSLPLLIALGWYLMILRREDSAATGAIVASSS